MFGNPACLYIPAVTTAGNYIQAGIPNIKGGHSVQGSEYNKGTATGAFTATKTGSVDGGGITGSGYLNYISFDASLCSNAYGKSTTVQPNSLTVRHYIKY